MSMWVQILLETLLPVLLNTLRLLLNNPASMAAYKEILLAIRDAINAMFPGEALAKESIHWHAEIYDKGKAA